MDTNNSTQWIVVGVVAVILIAGGAWLFMRDSADDMDGVATTTPNGTSTTTGSTGTTTNNGSTGTTTAATSEELTVGDQPAGTSVLVESVTVPGISWIAVRDSLRIYGAARVNAGTTENVSVKLLRPTDAGKIYQVMVYVDDGDRSFDFKKDALVSGISDSFTAQGAVMSDE